MLAGQHVRYDDISLTFYIIRFFSQYLFQRAKGTLARYCVMENMNAGFDPLPTSNPTDVDKLGGGFGGGNFSGNFSGRPNFNSGRFRNDENNTTAPMLLGLGGALLFISIGLLTARLWSRLRPWRLNLDDWTAIGATVRTFHLTRTTVRRETYIYPTASCHRPVPHPLHLRR